MITASLIAFIGSIFFYFAERFNYGIFMDHYIAYIGVFSGIVIVWWVLIGGVNYSCFATWVFFAIIGTAQQIRTYFDRRYLGNHRRQTDQSA